MKHTWRTGWLPLLAALAAVMILAACGDDQPPAAELPAGEPVVETSGGSAEGAPAAGSAGAAAAAQPPAPTLTPTPPPQGRVVLWHSWGRGDADALGQILGSFAAQYPQVTVDTLFIADSELPKAYADAVLAGAGPDLVLAPTWWLSDFVQLGVVQPIDTLVDAQTLAGYWPATLDNLRTGGQLYGLPTNFELAGLFANTSLTGGAPPPATTADLLAQAQAAPAQGAGLYNSLFHLYWGLPAYGGQLFDADGAVVIDQGGDAAGYLAWLRQMSQAPGSYVDTDYGMLLDRFKKGEFAYFVDGPWAIDELSAALGSSLAVLPLPSGPAGPAGPWLYTNGVLFNPLSSPEQRGLALLFARHLTSAESGSLLASAARRLPANRNAVIGGDPILQGFMNQAATAQAMPNTPEMAAVWGYLGDMLIKVVDGGADPEATVAETATLINEANGR
jgi:maltose-binding protein MalE